MQAYETRAVLVCLGMTPGGVWSGQSLLASDKTNAGCAATFPVWCKSVHEPQTNVTSTLHLSTVVHKTGRFPLRSRASGSRITRNCMHC